MRAFRALTVEENGSGVKRNLVMKNTDNLGKDEVLVKVKYSCLNYHDLLVLSGDKSINAKYPVTPGNDASGIVEESRSDSFKAGDEVIVTGAGLGINRDGGLGQYIQVPAEWLISLPTGLTLKDAMTIGTEGLAAAIAVMEITSAAAEDKDKNVIITGPTMGTGAFATGIMALCGYNVTAITMRKDDDDFIRSLGASEIIHYEKFIDKSANQHLKEKYCAAVDNFGGDALGAIVMSIKRNGSIASCNTILSGNATIPVNALILGGINLIGIDALFCSHKLRMEAWYKLAGEWYLKTLPWLCDEVSLMDIEEYIAKMVRGESRGRIVVNHDI